MPSEPLNDPVHPEPYVNLQHQNQPEPGTDEPLLPYPDTEENDDMKDAPL
jgi:hypothetical protein